VWGVALLAAQTAILPHEAPPVLAAAAGAVWILGMWGMVRLRAFRERSRAGPPQSVP
jgi:hypothetical protein